MWQTSFCGLANSSTSAKLLVNEVLSLIYKSNKCRPTIRRITTKNVSQKSLKVLKDAKDYCTLQFRVEARERCFKKFEMTKGH